VKTLKPSPALWLDTGCGTGRLVEAALTAFPETRFVLADPAEGMLARAKERLKHAPAGRVRYLPPVASQALTSTANDLRPQVITAVLCHHYLRRPDRREAVRCCHQLLDADGLFISFENTAPDTSTGVRAGLDRWKRFQVEHGKPQIEAEEHARRFDRDYFPITVAEHLELLRATGFKTAELFWFAYLQAGFYAIK